MNIEELSKAQLILLTILINFVTSVATGILTVSLLDQAPQVVTQTINRVVDRTIEKVSETVPSIVQPSPAPSTQDLVMSAIATNAGLTAALYDAKTGTSTPALTLGVFIPDARLVVTADRETLPQEVLVEFANDTRAKAAFSHRDSGLVVYKFADSVTVPKIATPQLVSSKDLKLGQTAIAIGIDGSASTGIVSRISSSGVHTTLPDIGAGSVVVNLSGDLIGVVARGTTKGLLVNTETITTVMKSAAKP